METVKFKTNIKCGGCIAAVRPYLEKLADIEKWEVDTESPDKILTIESQSAIEELQIVSTLEQAGYKAEKV